MISRIRISNFRSLVDVTVDLDPLTVLIGRSGTGKTNFVQALKFLRDSLTAREPVTTGNKFGGATHILHADRLGQPFGYEVNFSIAGLPDSFEYRLVIASNFRVIDESLQMGKTVLFHRDQTTNWVHPPDTIPLPTPQGIMLGAIPGLQELTFAYAALQSGIGCYDFPGSVIAGPGNQNQPVDAGFTDFGENYLSVANRIHSDLTKANSWKRIVRNMRAVNATVKNLIPSAPDPNTLFVNHQIGDRLLTMDVRWESEGFRRYLAHLLAMYQNPSKQTLLFEHPESGLHPGALESLANEFKACPEDGRGQVVVTTHSPQLLDYFPIESLRVVDLENFQTKIGTVAPEQMESLREHLLQPGELLTVDPARLPGKLVEAPG